MRTVFDTSVMVSALLIEDSVPARAFQAGRTRGTILLSNATFAELSEVLSRKKFRPFIAPHERESFLAVLLRECELVAVERSIQVCRDAKDDKFLELAVDGRADILVTGDRDLLVMDRFRSIAIVSPERFLSLPEFGTEPR